MTTPRTALTLVLLAAGCVDRFATPSAYEEQRYLCDQPAAFAALDDQCAGIRASGGTCAGVISFRGRLQGQPLTVSSTFGASVFSYVQLADQDGTRLLERIDTAGSSPYFKFDFVLKSIGGSLDVASDTPRTLRMNSGASNLPMELRDDQVYTAFRFISGGESVEILGAAGGEVVVGHQSRIDLAASFSGSFGTDPADAIEGCLHNWALETVKETVPNP